MSKPMKLLVLLFIVALLAAVVLTMLGKPPNLPLGPLQGILASEEEPIDEGGGGSVATPAPADTNPCPPGQILAPSAAGAGAGTGGAAGTPGAGAGAATPGAATGTDAAAGAAGAGATPGSDASVATPGAAATPTGAAMVGVSDRSWDGEARILAAGDGGSDQIADTVMVVDPPAGTADPAAAGGAAGTTDATAGAAPAAGAVGTDAGAGVGAGAAAATDPAAAATDPAAAAAAAATNPNCIPDPAAAGAGGAGGTGGAGAGTNATPGGAGATSTPGGAGATPNTGAATTPKTTTDGTNVGNSPEALRMAQDITGVMQQAKITVSVTATLVPATGGTAPAAQLKVYRARVTGAVLVIKLSDQTAMEQWTSAGKPVQTQLVKSFIQRLGKTYPKAVRSISVVDSAGNLLAVGDAAVGGGANAGAVKLY